jgi:N-methylhydantoinase A
MEAAGREDAAWLGIDVGGTFVDFALTMPPGGLVTHKVLADPHDLANSVMGGLVELASLKHQTLPELLGELRLIVHGTTVATNAVLTQSGNRTGLLTTVGTRDALEMRRAIKEEPLDNKYQGPPPLVPRYLRLPVQERVDSAGQELMPVDLQSVEQALQTLAAHQVEAVAICFMYAYANDAHEQQVADLVRAALPEVYVTTSSALMPQLGYYARVSTTVLNSYVGPLLSSYLLTLSRRLEASGYRGTLLIMNSTGGVMSPEETSRRPAAALVSGPAAGPVAGRLYAEHRGVTSCVVADMGGTSFDVSLVWGGEPLVTTEGSIGRYALALPILDIRSIGAGGGSIAWIDDGGLLYVGPQSAGASPGPACYGRGGDAPTCTDANVLLGYIDPDYFLGGRMRLDPAAAERAVRTSLADPLGLTTDEAAIAVFEVINTNMATGIRDMIVDHAVDPQDMLLVMGGGAGGIHAGSLAAELGIGEVVIPRESAVFCAGGMLFADLKHDLVRGYYVSAAVLDRERWRGIFDAMEQEGRARLQVEGAHPGAIEINYAADMRYARQLHEITVPLTQDQMARADLGELHGIFDRHHERLFGYCLLDHPLHVVSLRATCIGRLPKPELPRQPRARTGAPAPKGSRRAYVPGLQGFDRVPVYSGHDIQSGSMMMGPAIVELPQTTIFVPSACSLSGDEYGSFVLRLQADALPR